MNKLLQNEKVTYNNVITCGIHDQTSKILDFDRINDFWGSGVDMKVSQQKAEDNLKFILFEFSTVALNKSPVTRTHTRTQGNTGHSAIVFVKLGCGET